MGFFIEANDCGMRARRSRADHVAIRRSLEDSLSDGITHHRVIAEERTNRSRGGRTMSTSSGDSPRRFRSETAM